MLGVAIVRALIKGSDGDIQTRGINDTVSQQIRGSPRNIPLFVNIHKVLGKRLQGRLLVFYCGHLSVENIKT